ncbi:MAG: LysM peptidoglycan-binding domain-containing protein [Actinomycetota bacterium]
MIRQNRAVPILMVLTLAWVLYLAGCFGSEEPTVSAETVAPTAVIATPSPPPVVTERAPAALAQPEEPFVYTIQEGDLLGSIATKFNVTPDVILRANPDLNANVLFAGDTIRIPGATTVNTIDEDREAARDAGEPIDYVIVEGDSLGAIATTWTVTIASIVESNPGLEPNTLQIGQLIVIPPYGTGYSPEELAAFSTPEPVVREPGQILYHEVAPGDLLSELALVYQVTVDEILAANNLSDPNQLVIGQELAIPPPSVAAAEDG